MDLSTTLLLDFFEQARTHVKKRLPERRLSGRLALAATAKIHIAGDKALVDVSITNLSTGGIALIVPKPMTVGLEFQLRLEGANSAPQWLRCKTTRWQPSSSGACQIGAAFLDLVCTDTGEIPVLIDPAAPASQQPEISRVLKELADLEPRTTPPPPAKPGAAPGNKESRRARRVPIRFFSTAIRIDNGASSHKIRIHLQDISTGGAGFLCQTALPVGARVAINLTFAHEKSKTILARVVRCARAHPNQFLVGAQMIEACEQNAKQPEIPQRWLLTDA